MYFFNNYIIGLTVFKLVQLRVDSLIEIDGLLDEILYLNQLIQSSQQR